MGIGTHQGEPAIRRVARACVFLPGSEEQVRLSRFAFEPLLPPVRANLARVTRLAELGRADHQEILYPGIRIEPLALRARIRELSEPPAKIMKPREARKSRKYGGRMCPEIVKPFFVFFKISFRASLCLLRTTIPHLLVF